MNRTVLIVVGVVVTVAAGGVLAARVLSGAQPWGPTLLDNLLFAQSIPFSLGLGVLIGAVRGMTHDASAPAERRADGAVRRFSPGTTAMHWIATVGFLLALVSGAWQYLKGILDVSSPVFMPYVYRLHYVGATLLLFASASMVAYWLVGGVRGLTAPPGQRIRHLRGLAHELPRPLGGVLAALLGLNMRRQRPPAEQFTYYETMISFPSWTVLLALIVITGLIKALRYLYPIPGELLYWISAFHVTGMVLLAIKLLDHMRYVMAPSRWPLFVSMITTWVGERYVQLRHPGWLEALPRREGVDEDTARRGAPADASSTRPPSPAVS